VPSTEQLKEGKKNTAQCFLCWHDIENGKTEMSERVLARESCAWCCCFCYCYHPQTASSSSTARRHMRPNLKPNARAFERVAERASFFRTKAFSIHNLRSCVGASDKQEGMNVNQGFDGAFTFYSHRNIHKSHLKATPSDTAATVNSKRSFLVAQFRSLFLP